MLVQVHVHVLLPPHDDAYVQWLTDEQWEIVFIILLLVPYLTLRSLWTKVNDVDVDISSYVESSNQ